jgi:hypothetical protein
MVGGFKSEWWARSFVTVRDIISVCLGDIIGMRNRACDHLQENIRSAPGKTRRRFVRRQPCKLGKKGRAGSRSVALILFE